MNWRALGCGGLAAAAFVLLGVVGIWRALGPTACPDGFEVPSGAYVATGDRTSEPRVDGQDGELVTAGELGVGFARWPLWVEPGVAPSASGDPLPDQLVLACPDGMFQAYAEAGQ